MKKNIRSISPEEVLRQLIKRLGGHYSIKFAVTDDLQQRVILKNISTGEEKINVPIILYVEDPLDWKEISEKIVETLLNL